MKIKSNTTNNDLPWRFGLYQRAKQSHHYRGKNRKKN